MVRKALAVVGAALLVAMILNSAGGAASPDISQYRSKDDPRVYRVPLRVLWQMYPEQPPIEIDENGWVSVLIGAIEENDEVSFIYVGGKSLADVETPNLIVPANLKPETTRYVAVWANPSENRNDIRSYVSKHGVHNSRNRKGTQGHLATYNIADSEKSSVAGDVAIPLDQQGPEPGGCSSGNKTVNYAIAAAAGHLEHRTYLDWSWSNCSVTGFHGWGWHDVWAPWYVQGTGGYDKRLSSTKVVANYWTDVTSGVRHKRMGCTVYGYSGGVHTGSCYQ